MQMFKDYDDVLATLDQPKYRTALKCKFFEAILRDVIPDVRRKYEMQNRKKEVDFIDDIASYYREYMDGTDRSFPSFHIPTPSFDVYQTYQKMAGRRCVYLKKVRITYGVYKSGYYKNTWRSKKMIIKLDGSVTSKIVSDALCCWIDENMPNFIMNSVSTYNMKVLDKLDKASGGAYKLVSQIRPSSDKKGEFVLNMYKDIGKDVLDSPSSFNRTIKEKKLYEVVQVLDTTSKILYAKIADIIDSK